jgi:hypothetical protein
MWWGVYRVEGYLDFVGDAIYDTLANYCKKGFRIVRPMGGLAFWFRVVEKKHKDRPLVRIEGGLGKCKFTFRSDGKNAVFAADYYKDTEDTFRQVAFLLNFYRKDLGLVPVDFDSLYEIAGEDSPPVGADNYALFDGVDIKAFQNVLDKNFVGTAHREFSGKYSITVYSENAGANRDFYEKNIPVCQKFLEPFKGFYGYKDAMLVCVRRGKEQHVYFYVKDKGVFCNAQDASREFLEQEHGVLTRILSAKVRSK